VIIAHRFAFVVMYGVDALAEARLLGHRCDKPLCQRVAPNHVMVSSAVQNRREWSIRRNLPNFRSQAHAGRDGERGSCATRSSAGCSRAAVRA
jgi:hypothetical protein